MTSLLPALADSPLDQRAISDFLVANDHPDSGPIAIVIAAFEEADGIAEVVAALPDEVDGHATTVFVVDDGSSDATAELADHAGALTCRLPVNRGQGAALRVGYELARRCGAAIVVTTDADGQYRAEELESVVRPVLDDRADFVTGSRVLGSELTTNDFRRLGVRVFATLATVLSGRRITDTSFGMRAMRIEVPATVTLRQPQYQASELLMGLLAHGFRALEVPATMRRRSVGASKKGNDLLYGMRYARVLVGTWWRERR